MKLYKVIFSDYDYIRDDAVFSTKDKAKKFLRTLDPYLKKYGEVCEYELDHEEYSE